MTHKYLHQYLGLAGVDISETAAARRWGRMLEGPMLLIAFWILIEWYLDAKGFSSDNLSRITDWVIWSAFVFETLLLTILVKDKRRYLAGNWMNLLIIGTGIPVVLGLMPQLGFLRSLRLFIVFSILITASRNLRKMLATNHLDTTLLVSVIFITLSGILISGIDPAIDSAWDGLWWAWVTVTTVGYGDVVPVSPAGKILASILMLIGLALFSLLTASLSVFFIARSEDRLEEEIEEEIEETEAATLARLDQIEEQLNRIERMLEDKNRSG